MGGCDTGSAGLAAFKALTLMEERHRVKPKAQGVANSAWAFATLGQEDKKLFVALANEAHLRITEFNAQNIANTAWAFAKLG